MKKQILFFLVVILSISSFSQITFEKGYFIDNDNQKTNCLIRNVDWKNNPSQIEYKLSENSVVEKKTIKAIKEFGIDGVSKFIRKEVDIDRSGSSINNLSKFRRPIFKKEILFLKVLVQGKSSLYQYVDGDLKRYFFSKNSSNVNQLVYKSYFTDGEYIGKNVRYKQQLLKKFKCEGFRRSKIEAIPYKKKALVNFFKDYAKCTNTGITVFESKQKKDLFNITLRPRINSSSLSIENTALSFVNTKYESIINAGFGVELEYVFPFNKSKWALVIEPTYQSYKVIQTDDSKLVTGGKLVSDIKYSSIEIPLSVRHYMFLNNNAKLFVNVSAVVSVNLPSSVDFKRPNDTTFRSLSIDNGSNFALGFGGKFKDIYSVEFRYLTNREILNGYAFWNSNYQTISLIFGYTLF